MTALVLPLCLSLAVSQLTAPLPREGPDPARTSERDALRVLAALDRGEPGIREVQEAAARVAEHASGAARAFGRRARLAALLPRITAEVRREERTTRVVGLQSSGEVDYARLAPAAVYVVRASWDLGEIVASRAELAAAAAQWERARRGAEAVKRATFLYYERRRAQLALQLAPPEGALDRAGAALEVERLGAELDALTGGLLSEARR